MDRKYNYMLFKEISLKDKDTHTKVESKRVGKIY